MILGVFGPASAAGYLAKVLQLPQLSFRTPARKLAEAFDIPEEAMFIAGHDICLDFWIRVLDLPSNAVLADLSSPEEVKCCTHTLRVDNPTRVHNGPLANHKFTYVLTVESEAELRVKCEALANILKERTRER